MTDGFRRSVLEEWKGQLEKEAAELKKNKEQIDLEAQKVLIKIQFVSQLPNEELQKKFMKSFENQLFWVNKKVGELTRDIHVTNTLIYEINKTLAGTP